MLQSPPKYFISIELNKSFTVLLWHLCIVYICRSSRTYGGRQWGFVPNFYFVKHFTPISIKGANYDNRI